MVVDLKQHGESLAPRNHVLEIHSAASLLRIMERQFK